jgi:hypothetical protein
MKCTHRAKAERLLGNTEHGLDPASVRLQVADLTPVSRFSDTFRQRLSTITRRIWVSFPDTIWMK